jgi:dTMP kinase
MPLGEPTDARRYNCSLTGLFISFEGIDGSGKTTQLQLLRDKLAAQGHDVIVAQEPGGTRVGGEIRRLLLDAANSDLRPLPELLLYFASRAQNIDEVILPALEAGKTVLVDRFTDATVAYQGYGRELGVDVVRSIERAACRGIKPGLTLLIDVDPAVALPRAQARNKGQAQDEGRMEGQSMAFYERVRRGYLDLSRQEPERIKVIDGSDTVEAVAKQVAALADQYLKAREPAKAR